MRRCKGCPKIISDNRYFCCEKCHLRFINQKEVKEDDYHTDKFQG